MIEDESVNEEENEESEESEEDESDAEQEALEAEFTAHVEKIQKKIFKKVADAEAALEEAVDLADKHGVAFRSNISFLSQSYMPELLEKYSELDSEFVNDVTGTWSEYGGEGWEHSAVC